MALSEDDFEQAVINRHSQLDQQQEAINAFAEAFKSRVIREKGELYLACKARLPHGRYLKVLGRMSVSSTTAEDYAKLARDHGEELANSRRVGNLPFRQWIRISRSSESHQIIAKLESGEIEATPKAINTELEAAKQRNEELQETNQELQRSIDLFNEDRERERQEFENKIRTLQIDMHAKDEEILGHKQAQALIDQKLQSNDQELAHLREDLEKKPEPEQVEKLVTPPEVEANVKSMKEKITALEDENNKLLSSSSAKATEIEGLARERDSLAAEKEGLVKLANNNLFAETQAKYEAEVKDANRKMISIFDRGLRETRALLPASIDAKQAYGGDEWARVAWMRSQAVRFIEELDRLKESFESQFVDVSAMDTSRLLEPPIAFIEAG